MSEELSKKAEAVIDEIMKEYDQKNRNYIRQLIKEKRN